MRCALVFSFLRRCTVLAGAVMYSVCGAFPGERQDVVTVVAGGNDCCKQGKRYWGPIRHFATARTMPSINRLGGRVVDAVTTTAPGGNVVRGHRAPSMMNGIVGMKPQDKTLKSKSACDFRANRKGRSIKTTMSFDGPLSGPGELTVQKVGYNRSSDYAHALLRYGSA